MFDSDSGIEFVRTPVSTPCTIPAMSWSNRRRRSSSQ